MSRPHDNRSARDVGRGGDGVNGGRGGWNRGGGDRRDGDYGGGRNNFRRDGGHRGGRGGRRDYEDNNRDYRYNDQPRRDDRFGREDRGSRGFGRGDGGGGGFRRDDGGFRRGGFREPEGQLSEDRETGIIVRLVENKNFGFIKCVDRDEDSMFFHYSEVHSSHKPAVGDEVSFNILETRRGEVKAMRLEKLPPGTLVLEEVVCENVIGRLKSGLVAQRNDDGSLNEGFGGVVEVALPQTLALWARLVYEQDIQLDMPGEQKEPRKDGQSRKRRLHQRDLRCVVESQSEFEFCERDLCELVVDGSAAKMVVGDWVEFDVFMDRSTQQLGATAVRLLKPLGACSYGQEYDDIILATEEDVRSEINEDLPLEEVLQRTVSTSSATREQEERKRRRLRSRLLENVPPHLLRYKGVVTSVDRDLRFGTASCEAGDVELVRFVPTELIELPSPGLDSLELTDHMAQIAEKSEALAVEQKRLIIKKQRTQSSGGVEVGGGGLAHDLSAASESNSAFKCYAKGCGVTDVLEFPNVGDVLEYSLVVSSSGKVSAKRVVNLSAMYRKRVAAGNIAAVDPASLIRADYCENRWLVGVICSGLQSSVSPSELFRRGASGSVTGKDGARSRSHSNASGAARETHWNIGGVVHVLGDATEEFEKGEAALRAHFVRMDALYKQYLIWRERERQANKQKMSSSSSESDAKDTDGDQASSKESKQDTAQDEVQIPDFAPSSTLNGSEYAVRFDKEFWKYAHAQSELEDQAMAEGEGGAGAADHSRPKGASRLFGEEFLNFDEFDLYSPHGGIRHVIVGDHVVFQRQINPRQMRQHATNMQVLTYAPRSSLFGFVDSVDQESKTAVVRVAVGPFARTKVVAHTVSSLVPDRSFVTGSTAPRKWVVGSLVSMTVRRNPSTEQLEAFRVRLIGSTEEKRSVVGLVLRSPLLGEQRAGAQSLTRIRRDTPALEQRGQVMLLGLELPAGVRETEWPAGAAGMITFMGCVPADFGKRRDSGATTATTATTTSASSSSDEEKKTKEAQSPSLVKTTTLPFDAGSVQAFFQPASDQTGLQAYSAVVPGDVVQVTVSFNSVLGSASVLSVTLKPPYMDPSFRVLGVVSRVQTKRTPPHQQLGKKSGGGGGWRRSDNHRDPVQSQGPEIKYFVRLVPDLRLPRLLGAVWSKAFITATSPAGSVNPEGGEHKSEDGAQAGGGGDAGAGASAAGAHVTRPPPFPFLARYPEVWCMAEDLLPSAQTVGSSDSSAGSRKPETLTVGDLVELNVVANLAVGSDASDVASGSDSRAASLLRSVYLSDAGPTPKPGDLLRLRDCFSVNSKTIQEALEEHFRAEPEQEQAPEGKRDPHLRFLKAVAKVRSALTRPFCRLLDGTPNLRALFLQAAHEFPHVACAEMLKNGPLGGQNHRGAGGGRGGSGSSSSSAGGKQAGGRSLVARPFLSITKAIGDSPNFGKASDTFITRQLLPFAWGISSPAQTHKPVAVRAIRVSKVVRQAGGGGASAHHHPRDRKPEPSYIISALSGVSPKSLYRETDTVFQGVVMNKRPPFRILVSGVLDQSSLQSQYHQINKDGSGRGFRRSGSRKRSTAGLGSAEFLAQLGSNLSKARELFEAQGGVAGSAAQRRRGVPVNSDACGELVRTTVRPFVGALPQSLGGARDASHGGPQAVAVVVQGADAFASCKVPATFRSGQQGHGDASKLPILDPAKVHPGAVMVYDITNANNAASDQDPNCVAQKNVFGGSSVAVRTPGVNPVWLGGPGGSQQTWPPEGECKTEADQTQKTLRRQVFGAPLQHFNGSPFGLPSPMHLRKGGAAGELVPSSCYHPSSIQGVSIYANPTSTLQPCYATAHSSQQQSGGSGGGRRGRDRRGRHDGGPHFYTPVAHSTGDSSCVALPVNSGPHPSFMDAGLLPASSLGSASSSAQVYLPPVVGSLEWEHSLIGSVVTAPRTALVPAGVLLPGLQAGMAAAARESRRVGRRANTYCPAGTASCSLRPGDMVKFTVKYLSLDPASLCATQVNPLPRLGTVVKTPSYNSAVVRCEPPADLQLLRQSSALLVSTVVYHSIPAPLGQAFLASGSRKQRASPSAVPASSSAAAGGVSTAAAGSASSTGRSDQAADSTPSSPSSSGTHGGELAGDQRVRTAAGDRTESDDSDFYPEDGDGESSSSSDSGSSSGFYEPEDDGDVDQEDLDDLNLPATALDQEYGGDEELHRLINEALEDEPSDDVPDAGDDGQNMERKASHHRQSDDEQEGQQGPQYSGPSAETLSVLPGAPPAPDQDSDADPDYQPGDESSAGGGASSSSEISSSEDGAPPPPPPRPPRTDAPNNNNNNSGGGGHGGSRGKNRSGSRSSRGKGDAGGSSQDGGKSGGKGGRGQSRGRDKNKDKKRGGGGGGGGGAGGGRRGSHADGQDTHGGSGKRGRGRKKSKDEGKSGGSGKDHSSYQGGKHGGRGGGGGSRGNGGGGGGHRRGSGQTGRGNQSGVSSNAAGNSGGGGGSGSGASGAVARTPSAALQLVSGTAVDTLLADGQNQVVTANEFFSYPRGSEGARMYQQLQEQAAKYRDAAAKAGLKVRQESKPASSASDAGAKIEAASKEDSKKNDVLDFFAQAAARGRQRAQGEQKQEDGSGGADKQQQQQQQQQKSQSSRKQKGKRQRKASGEGFVPASGGSRDFLQPVHTAASSLLVPVKIVYRVVPLSEQVGRDHRSLVPRVSTEHLLTSSRAVTAVLAGAGGSGSGGDAGSTPVLWTAGAGNSKPVRPIHQNQGTPYAGLPHLDLRSLSHVPHALVQANSVQFSKSSVLRPGDALCFGYTQLPYPPTPTTVVDGVEVTRVVNAACLLTDTPPPRSRGSNFGGGRGRSGRSDGGSGRGISRRSHKGRGGDQQQQVGGRKGHGDGKSGSGSKHGPSSSHKHSNNKHSSSNNSNNSNNNNSSSSSKTEKSGAGSQGARHSLKPKPVGKTRNSFAILKDEK